MLLKIASWPIDLEAFCNATRTLFKNKTAISKPIVLWLKNCSTCLFRENGEKTGTANDLCDVISN